jgi:hypothetical protein
MKVPNLQSKRNNQSVGTSHQSVGIKGAELLQCILKFHLNGFYAPKQSNSLTRGTWIERQKPIRGKTKILEPFSIVQTKILIIKRSPSKRQSHVLNPKLEGKPKRSVKLKEYRSAFMSYRPIKI